MQNQIAKYNNISKLFIEDLKEFTKKPNKLDIIKISELLDDFQSYGNSNWNFLKLEKFDALYNYALADKKFKNFHNKKNDERKKFTQKVKKDIRIFLRNSNSTLKTFIGTNLGTDSAKTALKLAKKISIGQQNSNISNSLNLIKEINKWKKINNINDKNKLSKDVVNYLVNLNSEINIVSKKDLINKKIKNKKTEKVKKFKDEVGDRSFVLSPIRKPTAMGKATKYWKCDGLVNKKLIEIIYKSTLILSKNFNFKPIPDKNLCVYSISEWKDLGIKIYSVQHFVNNSELQKCIDGQRCEYSRTASFLTKNKKPLIQYQLSNLTENKVKYICVDFKSHKVVKKDRC